MKIARVLALAVAFAALDGGEAAAAGVLLVGNKSAQSMFALDLGSGERVAEFATGTGPHEIDVSRDRRYAVVANYGAEQPGHTLSVFDWPARKLARTIDLGADTRPHGLRFLADGRRVLVTTEGSGSLLEVDVAAGRVTRRIAVGSGKPHMVAVAPDGGAAYVTQVNGGVLSRIDLRAGVKSGELATGAGTEGVAVTRDGREVWVTSREAGTVSVVDTATFRITATLPSTGFPIRVALTPDDRHVLVVNAKAATLSVFDRAARKQAASVDLHEPGATYRPSMLGETALPIGVRVDPDGRRAYVAISGGDRVAVIDVDGWKVRTHWTTGREPDALAIVEAGPRRD